MTSFRPGLCSVTFRKLAPRTIVRLAAECGIEGIEWAGDVHVLPGQFDLARHVRRLTESAGLAVVSYGSYIAPPSDDDEAFATVLETAQALGAPNIRIWPGVRNRDSATYSADERKHTAALIRRMARRAAEASVTLGLEYHPNSLTDDLASAQALMAEIDDPNVFLYWQPRPGLPLAEALDELRAIGHETSHVHVFAWDKDKARYPLSDQRAYWIDILSNAPATRWPGDRFAMLEFVRDDSPEQFRADAAVFHRMLEEAGERPSGAARSL
ncbi:sugar phosphate isomerase/epimerase family protein [Microvirga lotononidis]|uniref:Xylose isomerase-like enzyme n=1 Tax=Microvirga lotononidis TaxID=864069 RepID=I4YL00_9HYPH|nr:TIM barrel protein [Microvirga lotononidis]EIM24642.1 xylose isomerase-like enzyme [Microvirga lotononidis]WQO26656.1 TIM barrel protein [Microvirga lotononidis]